MNRGTVWTATLLMGALAVACGGQGQNSSSGTQGAAGTAGHHDVNGGRTMTLRGCVQPGDPAGTYVLQTAGPAKGAGDHTSAVTGNTDVNGTRPDQNGPATYRLIATGNLDFGRNEGKEVAITGEIATQAQDGSGAPGNSPTGNIGTSGSSDRRNRQGTSGEGAAGTDLESGGSRGSGNGRVQGSAPDQTAGAQFFRVTSMTKVSDTCPTAQQGSQK